MINTMILNEGHKPVLECKNVQPCFQKTNEQQGYNEACCEYGWRHIFCIWLCLQLSDFHDFSLVYL